MIKSFFRRIDVWTDRRVCVEREGDTISIQVAFPGDEKAAIVVDIEAATQLLNLLQLATAIRVEGTPV